MTFSLDLSGGNWSLLYHKGPVKNPCSVCTKPVATTHRAVECDSCLKWCHIGRKCRNIPTEDYKLMISSARFQWRCLSCLNRLPSCQQQQQQGVENRPNPKNICLDGEFQDTKLSNELTEHGKAHLKLGHVNVNGIMTLSKLREIKVLLQTAKFDIFGITETKLTSSTTDEQLDIEGYKFIRKDREKEDGGGGCMLYYLEDLDLYDIIRTKLEAIWVDVELHSQRISLSMMYRPPKDQNFFNTLSDEIEKLWAQKKNILIMGDLMPIFYGVIVKMRMMKKLPARNFCTLLIDLVLKM